MMPASFEKIQRNSSEPTSIEITYGTSATARTATRQRLSRSRCSASPIPTVIVKTSAKVEKIVVAAKTRQHHRRGQHAPVIAESPECRQLEIVDPEEGIVEADAEGHGDERDLDDEERQNEQQRPLLVGAQPALPDADAGRPPATAAPAFVAIPPDKRPLPRAPDVRPLPR